MHVVLKAVAILAGAVVGANQIGAHVVAASIVSAAFNNVCAVGGEGRSQKVIKECRQCYRHKSYVYVYMCIPMAMFASYICGNASSTEETLHGNCHMQCKVHRQCASVRQ